MGTRKPKKRSLALKMKYLEEVARDMRDDAALGRTEIVRVLERLKPGLAGVSPASVRPPTVSVGDVPPISEETAARAAEAMAESGVPPWAKEAFRKIARVAHPDVVSHRRDMKEQDKIRLANIFKDANEAMAKGNFNRLIEIAIDLDISVPKSEESQLDIMAQRVSQLEEEIKGLEGSAEVFWVSASLQERVKIILAIAAARGHRASADEAAAAISPPGEIECQSP